jgi:hypothetical protein
MMASNYDRFYQQSSSSFNNSNNNFDGVFDDQWQQHEQQQPLSSSSPHSALSSQALSQQSLPFMQQYQQQQQGSGSLSSKLVDPLPFDNEFHFPVMLTKDHSHSNYVTNNTINSFSDPNDDLTLTSTSSSIGMLSPSLYEDDHLSVTDQFRGFNVGHTPPTKGVPAISHLPSLPPPSSSSSSSSSPLQSQRYHNEHNQHYIIQQQQQASNAGWGPSSLPVATAPLPDTCNTLVDNTAPATATASSKPIPTSISSTKSSTKSSTGEPSRQTRAHVHNDELVDAQVATSPVPPPSALQISNEELRRRVVEMYCLGIGGVTRGHVEVYATPSPVNDNLTILQSLQSSSSSSPSTGSYSHIHPSSSTHHNHIFPTAAAVAVAATVNHTCHVRYVESLIGHTCWFDNDNDYSDDYNASINTTRTIITYAYVRSITCWSRIISRVTSYAGTVTIIIEHHINEKWYWWFH